MKHIHFACFVSAIMEVLSNFYTIKHTLFKHLYLAIKVTQLKLNVPGSKIVTFPFLLIFASLPITARQFPNLNSLTPIVFISETLFVLFSCL